MGAPAGEEEREGFGRAYARTLTRVGAWNPARTLVVSGRPRFPLPPDDRAGDGRPLILRVSSFRPFYFVKKTPTILHTSNPIFVFRKKGESVCRVSLSSPSGTPQTSHSVLPTLHHWRFPAHSRLPSVRRPLQPEATETRDRL